MFQVPLINSIYQGNYLDLNLAGFRDAKLCITGEMKTMEPLAGGDFFINAPLTIVMGNAKHHSITAWSEPHVEWPTPVGPSFSCSVTPDTACLSMQSMQRDLAVWIFGLESHLTSLTARILQKMQCRVAKPQLCFRLIFLGLDVCGSHQVFFIICHRCALVADVVNPHCL